MEQFTNPIRNADPLITRPEAAAYLGFKPSTLEVWAVKGHGPRFIKLGLRSVRYRLSELDRWLTECAKRSGATGGVSHG